MDDDKIVWVPKYETINIKLLAPEWTEAQIQALRMRLQRPQEATGADLSASDPESEHWDA